MKSQTQGMGMSWLGIFLLSLLMSIPIYYLMHRMNISLHEIARRFYSA